MPSAALTFLELRPEPNQIASYGCLGVQPHCPPNEAGFVHFGSRTPLTQTERYVATRSFGLLYVIRSRLIVVATLLPTFAATPTSGSPPENGTWTGRETLGNDGTASGSSSVQLAAGTTQPLLGQPASVPKSAAFSTRTAMCICSKPCPRGPWHRTAPMPKSLVLS